jgi:hypothetical protein
MRRYAIWYKPVSEHEKIIIDGKKWQWCWIERDFVSIRAAIRYARVHKLFCFVVYDTDNKLASNVLYSKGVNYDFRG